jgi:Cof subfamily protein (haloacid dehalogenase superfamily)
VNKQIKLLMVDIDGTIAGKSNQVTERVKSAIRAAKARGVRVGVATGRMYASARRFHHDIEADVPLLAYQGAWIQDPQTNELHRHLPLPVELARAAVDYFEQPEIKDKLSVHVYLDDRLYVRSIEPETVEYVQRSGVTAHPIGDLRDILTAGPTKILAMSPDEELIDRLLQDLRQKYPRDAMHVTTSVPIFLELTNAAVNKATAIDYVATKMLGITSAEVMAIGDNYNDVEMLEYAGVGVAMGNAPPAVQQIADWVTTDVAVDGVADAIERFIIMSQ